MGSSRKTGVARRRITFRYPAGRDCDVRVAGTFNGWDAAAHPLRARNGSGESAVTVLVPPGRHAYKFIVDGEWQCDPSNAERAPDGFGGENSVLEIARPRP